MCSPGHKPDCEPGPWNVERKWLAQGVLANPSAPPTSHVHACAWPLQKGKTAPPHICPRGNLEAWKTQPTPTGLIRGLGELGQALRFERLLGKMQKLSYSRTEAGKCAYELGDCSPPAQGQTSDPSRGVQLPFASEAEDSRAQHQMKEE